MAAHTATQPSFTSLPSNLYYSSISPIWSVSEVSFRQTVRSPNHRPHQIHVHHVADELARETQEVGATPTVLSRSRLLGSQNSREFGKIVPDVFTPVLAKHSKSFWLIDCISVGVDRMQRNFEPMRRQVEARQTSKLTEVTAKVVIYEAFVEGELEAPKLLLAPSMTFTSSRSTRNSSRGPSGVSRTRSLLH